MTPRERQIVRSYFAADLNAKMAGKAIRLSAERVRQVVRKAQEEMGCQTRVDLWRHLETSSQLPAPPRRRARLVPDGQELLW